MEPETEDNGPITRIGDRKYTLDDLLVLDLITHLAPEPLWPAYMFDWERFKQAISGKVAGTVLVNPAIFAAVAFDRISRVHRFPGRLAWKKMVILLREHAKSYLDADAFILVDELDPADQARFVGAMKQYECKEHEPLDRFFLGKNQVYKLEFCQTCLTELSISRQSHPRSITTLRESVPAMQYARILAAEMGLVADDHGFIGAFKQYLDPFEETLHKTSGMPAVQVLALFCSAFETTFEGASLPLPFLSKTIRLVESMQIFGPIGVDLTSFDPGLVLDAMCSHDTPAATSYVDTLGIRYAVSRCTKCGKRLSQRQASTPGSTPKPADADSLVSVVTFKVSNDLFNKFKIYQYTINAETNDEVVRVLVSLAKPLLNPAGEKDTPAIKRARRALYAGMVANEARSPPDPAETPVSLKIRLPSREAVDFRTMKARLAAKNNESMLEMLLAVAANMEK